MRYPLIPTQKVVKHMHFQDTYMGMNLSCAQEREFL